MNLITPTALAKKIGISRQAVFDAIENFAIPFILDGNRKKIDLDDKGVQSYIVMESDTRIRAKEKRAKKQSKKIQKKKTPSKKKTENIDDITEDQGFNGLSPFQIKVRKEFAIMKKKEIEAEIAEKKSLPLDFVQHFVFRHIEKLHTTIERTANVSFKEIGDLIIESGEVQPKHIEKFTNTILEAIHNSKKAIIKEIKKYEPDNK